MDLKYLIKKIEEICVRYPLIESFEYSDVYNATSKDNVKYPLFVCDYTGNHSVGNPISTFSFDFHFIDRLLDDESNKLDVQNESLKTFNDILLYLQDIDGIDIGLSEVKNLTFFEDSLSGSLVAGGTITVPIMIVTNDYYCQIIN